MKSGINLAMIQLRAHSLKGKRSYNSKPSNRGQNVSMIGALRFQSILADYNPMGTTDGITFRAFIRQKLVPKLWKGTCVVMDNYSIQMIFVLGSPIVVTVLQ